jgi:peptide/nickel transport system substrate-binding protein
MHRKRRHVTTAIVAVLTIGTISLAGTASTAGAGGSGDSEVVWGLEAETTGGYCLPNARLAAAGIQVATAVYDSLMAINAKGEYSPYLAESFTPNATYDEWTIKLRPGITFHNGEPLDAEAVKLNIDSFRGQNPDIAPQLFLFVFEDIDTVTVADPLTVVVTTKQPWVAFPAFWSGGRTGIAAPEQLSSGDVCATQLIGTGPFRFVEFRQNESLTVEKNPDYWRKGYPKLDRIVFKPIPEAQVRNNGLVSGDLDIIQAGGAVTLRLDDLKQKAEAGELQVLVSEAGAETSYVMLNMSKPPFDDPIARQAVAFAGDAREANDIRNKGQNTISTGPFAPDNAAHLDTAPRKHNLKKAKELAAEYEATHGEPLTWEYLTNPDPDVSAIAQLVKEQNAKAGIEVSIRLVDQATLIGDALAGNFQGAGFRNHPGGDPDTQYVWWHSGSPVNFGRITDAEIDRLLEEGRGEPDPDKRVEIYTELNERFASELYNLWSWYTLWGLGFSNDVSGVKGPALPDGGGKPAVLFGGVTPVLGITKK